MKVAKQFHPDELSGVSVLLSDEDAFVPEMSLPIEQILQQFSYVDNIRLSELSRQGFEYADADEDDFDVEDFDRLDPAEREEIYGRASAIVDAYQRHLDELQKQNDAE